MMQHDSIDWGARFQQAALDPSQWLSALTDMARATGSARGQLIGVGGTTAVPFNWVNDFSAESFNDFVRIGGASPTINYRIAADMGITPGAVVHEAEYRRARPRLTSEIYLDFCREVDIPFGCQAKLIEEDGAMIGLAVLRTEADGVTTEAQRDTFAQATAGARSAVRLQRAIEHQGMQLVAGTLEAMATDCLLLDGFGRVGAMTPGAERAVTAGDTIRIVDHVLSGATRVLAQRIAQALRAVLVERVPVRVSLGGGRRLDLFVLARQDWGLSFRPHAIAVLRDTRSEMALEIAALAREYGLSRAEAGVAELIAGGYDREAIAARRGVSIETLKSQIKAIYLKTGCTREAELVALVAGLRG